VTHFVLITFGQACEKGSLARALEARGASWVKLGLKVFLFSQPEISYVEAKNETSN